MIPEQQKLALLEWAGWQERGGGPEGIYYTHPERDGEFLFGQINLSSLDIIAEFEGKLTPHQRRNYPQELASVCGIGEGEEWTDDEDWTIIHASAPQRLEALVRALGLWREEQF